MLYYLDTEFDGHGGPLLSLALVREDGSSLYVTTSVKAQDPWVQEHVVPVMGEHKATAAFFKRPVTAVGGFLRSLLWSDLNPVIVADSPVDIWRFCQALSTKEDGGWHTYDGPLHFEVHDVAAYPTTLEGAVQHSAWWDAMALRHALT